MNKKIGNWLIITILMVSIFSIPVYADSQIDNITPNAVIPTYAWMVDSTSYQGTTVNGSSKVLLGTFIATRTGETFSATCSKTITYSFGGTVQASKSILSAALGFNVSSGVSLSITATSAPLTANHKVEAYYQYNYMKYQVTQSKHWNIAGQPADTTICYVYKPILPLVSFKYY